MFPGHKLSLKLVHEGYCAIRNIFFDDIIMETILLKFFNFNHSSIILKISQCGKLYPYNSFGAVYQ